MAFPRPRQHPAARLISLMFLTACAQSAQASVTIEPATKSSAQTREAASVLLRVYPVRIQCAKAPCPTHAIAALPANRQPSLPPDAILFKPRLFLKDRPPSFEATDADRARLEAAWTQPTCLLVTGWLDDRTLRVHRVEGLCDDEAGPH